MKNLFFTTLTTICTLSVSTTQAATIEALSVLDFQSRWIALSDADNDDIGLVFSSNGSSTGADAQIDDPAAVSAISESDFQLGTIANPPTPFVSSARERVNRPDPTEFADAQRRTEVTRPLPDPVLFGDEFFSNFHEFDQTGLAQLRIGEPLVQASASSLFDSSATTTFENLTDEIIDMILVVQLDFDLTGRFDGDEGSARAEVTRAFEFSDTVDGAVVVDQGGGPNTLVETGAGANASSDLSSFPGNGGALFTASAIAQGDGGFTEARFTGSRNFTVLFEIPAFGTVSMTERYAQLNTVGFRDDVTPVPLPAGLPMLLAGLFAFGWLGVRRPSNQNC